MKNQLTTIKSGALPHFLRTTVIAEILPALVLLLSIQVSHAGSATWLATPATGDWNTATNWTPATVPNGPADTATFVSSNITAVSLSTVQTEVNGIVFDAGASAYTITVNYPITLTISGVGITNNSGTHQLFSNSGAIQFLNGATAGATLTFFDNNRAAFLGARPGFTEFFGTSTAGNGEFLNIGGARSGFGFLQAGFTEFFDTSTAGNSIFINEPSTSSTVSGGYTQFFNSSSAGDGTFSNDGANGTSPGYMVFSDTSTAGNATLIADPGSTLGGAIFFDSNSLGGTARVELFFSNGKLDISSHNPPGVTTGSIEGRGFVFLGANNLTVGSNNLSTTFSGVIQDGGQGGGTGGSLTKIGKGQLTLSHASTYTGGTTVSKGTLLVANTTGSGTGTGAVQVNKGTIGGTGIITGAVTVGTGTSSGAILLAGNNATSPGTLTVNNTLTFNSLSTYKCVLNRTTVIASQAVGLGVTINSNVPFTFVDTGTGTLTTGTVFTVINNTSANPISGTFSNLANGSVFTSNGNNFQASYTGGNSNDLTLTVVP